MTEPLPCPFCGHVGLSHNEGSTFRWLMTECNGCGAQCGEERINTMSMDRSAAIEQAKESAVVSWNTRAEKRPWVGLTDGEIYTAYITAANQTLRPQDERIAFAFARAIEAAHGIKEGT
jgi:hypothetical protein